MLRHHALAHLFYRVGIDVGLGHGLHQLGAQGLARLALGLQVGARRLHDLLDLRSLLGRRLHQIQHAAGHLHAHLATAVAMTAAHHVTTVA
jgi:hypothetical protein